MRQIHTRKRRLGLRDAGSCCADWRTRDAPRWLCHATPMRDGVLADGSGRNLAGAKELSWA